MSIWEYKDLARPFTEGFTAHVMERHTCLYCKTLLRPLKGVLATPHPYGNEASGKCCPNCGWWYVQEVWEGNHSHYSGGFSRLKNFEICEIAAPIDEVRQYLLANYASRFRVHPQVFEEVVASVFRSVGYSARVTAYSGDNGIDVYLDGPGDVLVGVQVKRWRGSIKVEQVHALGGALIVNRCTCGVFVTTSEFQRGARSNAQRFQAEIGIPIELVDSARLYSALEITSRPRIHKGSDPNAPWNLVVRPTLWTE